MKRLLILLSVMLLVGCIEEQSSYSGCDNKHSYTNDMVSSTGLTLKATSEAFITFGEMEAVYNDIQSCLNLWGAGPTIEYVSFTERDWGGSWAMFIVEEDSNNLVFMNTDTDFIPRNCHSDRETLRHEFVHHLLYITYEDATHTSELAAVAFTKCKALGVYTCNGVPCADPFQ